MTQAAIYPLINMLRVNGIAQDCRRCHKIWYRTWADAQAVADLTLVCDGELMDAYPVHRGWHLRNLTKIERHKRSHHHWRMAGALWALIEKKRNHEH